MNSVIRAVLLSWVLALATAPALASQDEHAKHAMAGIASHGQHQDQPYVTAGDRAYLIGTQDGNFPDLGGHVPGEMGGLWLHPIKLIDGFWAQVTDSATHQEAALSKSTDFVTYPYGTRFRYGPVLDSLDIERFQFSPDGQQGVIVQYEFKNAAARNRVLDLSILRQDGFETGLVFGTASGLATLGTPSPGNPPTAASSPGTPRTTGSPSGEPLLPRMHGQSTVPSRYTRVAWASPLHPATACRLPPHGTSTLTFVIAGSATDSTAAVNAYGYLAKHQASLLERKKAHYAALIERARITIPDRRLQEVYDWVRINAEWLVRDVPGIGRGLGAGLMEYPWWFGTETYSLQALMATGDFDLAKQTLRLLKSQSMKANGNGRIVHEVTTNGAISNPGNTQETAQFILTAGRLFEWTGDLDFAREMYPAMKMGLRWLLTDMDQNKDLFPGGYGIMEVSGLNAELIDVAVYTQQALRATAHIAGVLNEPKAAERYRQLASQLATRINERFWVEEEGSYADFYGTRAQAMSAAEGAIRQIGLKGANELTQRDRELMGYYERLKQKFSAMPDSTRGWLTNKNWVITTPMETGIAPRARALRLLDKIRRENVGEYGPFLSAVDKQAMMTISTGVQAVSEANYGRTDEAMWYVDKIVQTFNRVSPGSISEMMPDYGCFTIAWTSYGIVVPLIQHVFGIQPDALHKRVVFEPHLPTGWEDIRIEDLPVGTNLVSFSRARTGRGIEYDFEARQSGWSFVLRGKDVPGARYFLNGSPVSATASGIQMSGRKNHLLVAMGDPR